MWSFNNPKEEILASHKVKEAKQKINKYINKKLFKALQV